MRSDRNPLPGPGRPAGAESRRHGRLRLTCLACHLGPVADISKSGLRVVGATTAPAPGQVLDVRLEGVGEPFAVKARVAWARQTGRRAWDLGLAFVDDVVRTAVADGRRDLGAA
jgi:hypothetical protein